MEDDYDTRMEIYMENHGNDHDDEIREYRQRMDMRDELDQRGYN